MRIGAQFDLTYCSNIHPGESWIDVRDALARSLPHVRQMLGHTGPMGIGLRLSAAAATELDGSESRLALFIDFLHAGDYYVPTINGFPFGAFHGTRVKEQVYLPDWRSQERVEYSNRLARLLARFARARGQTHASISTVPGAFRSRARREGDAATMALRMLSHAAYLRRLRDEHDVTIALAIEPEPACSIETVDDVERFFTRYLFDRSLIAVAGHEANVRLTREDVVEHIGVCLDACHMAVEFEDAVAVLGRLRELGIGVKKVQLSSALRVECGAGRRSPKELLAPFAEHTYLHQVVTSKAGRLTRYTDLPEALDSPASEAASGEWRVHFHVPIFLDAMSGFGTTQNYLRALIHELVRTEATRCLEVETYTWDVLPQEYRTTDVSTAIARELDWVRQTLAQVA